MSARVPGWDRVLVEAQYRTHEEFSDGWRARIPYGEEPGLPAQLRPTCHDCGAALGQLHVADCSVERCPACGGQAIACQCVDVEQPQRPEATLQ